MGKMKWNGKFLCLCLLLAALVISASAAEDAEHFAGGSGAEKRYLAAGTTYMSKVRSYLDTHFNAALYEDACAHSVRAQLSYVSGTGGWDGEGDANLLDGDPSTKWCAKFGGDTQQMAELTCDIDLKAENTNLWAENNRKAKMIDMFIESQQGKKG